MKERGVRLVCTFSIFMHPTGIEQGDGRTPAIMEKVQLGPAGGRGELPRHLASGIRIAVGTDSMHGLMAFEMATLVRLGVSTHDALHRGHPRRRRGVPGGWRTSGRLPRASGPI